MIIVQTEIEERPEPMNGHRRGKSGFRLYQRKLSGKRTQFLKPSGKLSGSATGTDGASAKFSWCESLRF